MTSNDRLKMIVELLKGKISINEVQVDVNLQLHMNSLGYTLKYEPRPGEEFGDWILRCPNDGHMAIRNVEHLKQFFE